MASNKLFQELDLKHTPHRNGYDLGNRVNFTAKAGELLPIWHRTMMYGDVARVKTRSFTRTSPVVSPAQTEIREYFDWFFVPYRLLWKDSPQVHTNNLENPVSATSGISNRPIGTQLPQFDFNAYRVGTGYLNKLGQYKNDFGYNRGALSAKLMNHLGYGYFTVDNIKNTIEGDYATSKWQVERYMSLYPLLAYQCIYYNFFRNTLWEENVPYNYNVDYLSTSPIWSVSPSDSSATQFWANPTLFDLRYSNWPKDLFFGVMPSPQYGDEAVVDVGISDITAFSTSRLPVEADNGQQLSVTSNGVGLVTGATPPTGPVWADPSGAQFELDSARSTLGILTLRKAQFLQKYKEIRGSGNQTYSNIISKIYGINVNDPYQPVYLGGRSSSINISEIDNTNLGSEEDSAIQRGKGIGSSESDVIEFQAQEAGILMCIYHAQPVVDYALTNLHFDVTKTEFDDLANPIFDQLGFQELPFKYLSIVNPPIGLDNPESPSETLPSIVGYTTRYFDYKTSIDMTLGDFRESTPLKNFIAPIDIGILRRYDSDGEADGINLNSNFFHVAPWVLDPIFTLKSDPLAYDFQNHKYVNADFVVTDQLRVFATVEAHFIRPLDYHGVPY